MTSPRPFPFHALPAVSREAIALRARVRDAARAVLRPAQVAAALSALCNAPVSLAVGRTTVLDPDRGASDAVGAMFAPSDGPGLDRAVLVEVEAPLATTLVTLALRQRAPRVAALPGAPSPLVAGALAAVLHAALRSVLAEGVTLRVVRAGPAHALERELAGAQSAVATTALVVVVGDAAFAARVVAPVNAIPTAAPAFGREDLLSLDRAPLALPLVVASCLAGRGELGSLRPGDAFMPGTIALAAAGGRLLGGVGIVPGRAERGIAGVLEENGVLRVGVVEDHSWATSAHHHARSDDGMSGEANTTLQVLEEAPVVVRVELGVVELPAREWAALATGDVIALGRRLGDPAVLRVGGVEVARGELVQVEGEYGVRILPRGAS